MERDDIWQHRRDAGRGMSALPVVAMCMECRRGYVSVNWENPAPSCHACGGRLTKISPVPNEWPHVNGAFVVIKPQDEGGSK